MSAPRILAAPPLLMLAWMGCTLGEHATEPTVIARIGEAKMEVVFLAGGTAAFPHSAHCYAVIDTQSRQAVVIDAGPKIARAMRDYLDRRKVTVRYICITHAHTDHLAGLGDLLVGTAPRIVTHRVEALRFPPQWRPRSATSHGEGLPEETFLFLTDRQTLECGHFTIRALLTPGHTIGSLCYELLDADIVFVGDTIFRGSIGRTDLPDSAGAFCLRAYIQVQLLSLPETVQLLPGHGGPTTVGHELRYNPFFRRAALAAQEHRFASNPACREESYEDALERSAKPQCKGTS